MNRNAFGLRRALLGLAALLAAALPVHAQQGAAQKVDILFLIDDTVSFVPFQSELSQVVSDLIVSLENSRPGVDFAFGVTRFADYGGPGWDYCAALPDRPCSADRDLRINGRPFILNQPIVNATTAGSREQRNTLVADAFARTNPFDWGGDDPEAVLEALLQVATGRGFDGDGDGATTGTGGAQPAGAAAAQTAHDASGDVPSCSSLSGLSTSGTVGGVGFRPDALKIVVVATDTCPVVALPADAAIPATIRGRYSEELLADFSCMGATPGVRRFGYVGNAKSDAASTVANGVAPLGGVTISEAITALNTADIRVFGLGPSVKPVASGTQEPSFDPGQWLSAIARITGGVDSQGNPLVFDLAVGPAPLREQILASIVTVADKPQNPGCQDISILDQVTSVQNALREQQKLMARGLKFMKRGGLSAKKLKKQRTAMDKSFTAAEQVLKAFPQQVTVCSNLACDKVDRTAELTQVRNSLSSLNQQLTKGGRAVRRNKKLSKRMKALQKASSAALDKALSAVEQLPQTTNQCQAA